ncbi:MAG: hypothetical protein H5U19_09380 [Rhodobacteraceae bacterium]|nr:hypothetical protein [Paracoccaceae bacterium]
MAILMVCAVSIAPGMFMDPVSMIVLTLSVVCPPVSATGFDPGAGTTDIMIGAAVHRGDAADAGPARRHLTGDRKHEHRRHQGPYLRHRRHYS